MEFIQENNYEEAVEVIKSQMIPYYRDLGLEWDDKKKLNRYKECSLWKIRVEEEIGFFMVYEDERGIYLAELHIKPEKRGQGFGLETLAKIKDMAADLGYSEIRVGAFKNSPAYRLYLRAGFKLEKEAA